MLVNVGHLFAAPLDLVLIHCGSAEFLPIAGLTRLGARVLAPVMSEGDNQRCPILQKSGLNVRQAAGSGSHWRSTPMAGHLVLHHSKEEFASEEAARCDAEKVLRKLGSSKTSIEAAA